MFKAYSQNLYGDATKANPTTTATCPKSPNPDGTPASRSISAWAASHELVQVMPDQRTALMGDDATNSAYFVFVADRERPVLRHAVRRQGGCGLSIDPVQRAAQPSQWMKLGSATSAEIEHLANTLKPTDIMPSWKADHRRQLHQDRGQQQDRDWISSTPAWKRRCLHRNPLRCLPGASLGFTKMEAPPSISKDKVAYSRLQNAKVVHGGRQRRQRAGQRHLHPQDAEGRCRDGAEPARWPEGHHRWRYQQRLDARGHPRCWSAKTAARPCGGNTANLDRSGNPTT